MKLFVKISNNNYKNLTCISYWGGGGGGGNLLACVGCGKHCNLLPTGASKHLRILSLLFVREKLWYPYDVDDDDDDECNGTAGGCLLKLWLLIDDEHVPPLYNELVLIA